MPAARATGAPSITWLVTAAAATVICIPALSLRKAWTCSKADVPSELFHETLDLPELVLPRPPRDLEWLHIPKTGTSFGNTLVLWACPDLDPSKLWVTDYNSKLPPDCKARFHVENAHGWPYHDIGQHFSLTNRTDEQLHRVMTMVRYPPARVVSLYHHGRRMDTKQQLDNLPVNLNATEEEVCAWLEGSRWFSDVQGGQVKMIAGVPRDLNEAQRKWAFPDASPPSQAMVREACRRLELLAFVGITDYWDASVCLFHAQHGGAMHPVELKNVREAPYQQARSSLKHADCGDRSDHLMFECAMRLFRHRLRTHPHCKQYLLPDARAAFAA